MGKGEWTRYGRGLCEGYNLELGEAYRCNVSCNDPPGGGPTVWHASVNQHRQEFPDKDAAIRFVEFEIDQGMKRLNEDWAVFQATRILGMRQGKRKMGQS